MYRTHVHSIRRSKLHYTASGIITPIGMMIDKIPFHPYFTVRDILGFAITIIALTLLTLKEPYILRDPNNFNPANPLETPVHIQPE